MAASAPPDSQSRASSSARSSSVAVPDSQSRVVVGSASSSSSVAVSDGQADTHDAGGGPRPPRPPRPAAIPTVDNKRTDGRTGSPQERGGRPRDNRDRRWDLDGGGPLDGGSR
eukprot:265440-Prorocentrum_minimum.AAC.1